MRKVVVTGMGIWSCIGQTLDEVTESLRSGRSGIIADPSRARYGLKSLLVGNTPRPDLKPLLHRRFRINMSEDCEYGYIAGLNAFTQAGVNDEYLRKNEVGIIFGNDGAVKSIIETSDVMRESHDSFLVGPAALFRSETSSVTMNLATVFHLRGINMCVGAACASGSHAIGLGATFIRSGMQDMVLVGGSMETSKESAVPVDAIEALSQRNDAPTKASRPFDRDRDGMVSSGGAAALVLEEYEHARRRGAPILAEIAGYGFSSNGIDDISRPNGNAEYIAMSRALADSGLTADDIDYVNAHATSTVIGDIEEAKALCRLFKGRKAWISSTKSMTGHENWMAGASEAVYSILMMQNGFIAPNINLENVDECAAELNIARETIYTPVNAVLSNSSGMGGTNSALVLKKI